MADTNKKDESGANPMVIGIAGALVGAAATASAIALSDEKNRKKLEKVIADLKTHGEKLLEVVQKETGMMKELTSGDETKSTKKTAPKKIAVRKKKAA